MERFQKSRNVPSPILDTYIIKVRLFMSNAERELADLIGICEFCKTILCISKIFNAVFNKKSWRVSMKFFINACTGENQLFKKECHLLSLGFIIESLGGLNFH